jgi:hypothetical protein
LRWKPNNDSNRDGWVVWMRNSPEFIAPGLSDSLESSRLSFGAARQLRQLVEERAEVVVSNARNWIATISPLLYPPKNSFKFASPFDFHEANMT